MIWCIALDRERRNDDRLDFVNQQDIRNVMRNPNLHKYRLNAEDMVSVRMLVEQDEQTAGIRGWTNFFEYQSAYDSTGKGFQLGMCSHSH